MSKIISAFPGIGKSYFTKQMKVDHPELKVSDSDSSMFSWISEGERDPNFPENYMTHIDYKIMEQYHFIFISSHEDVRNALEEKGKHFYLVFPHESLKDMFLQRYRDRGNSESFIEILDKNWEAWLASLYMQDGCIQIVVMDDTPTSECFLQLDLLRESPLRVFFKNGNFYYDEECLYEVI